MNENRDRAWRRKQHFKKVEKAKKLFPEKEMLFSKKEYERWVHTKAETPKDCNCFACSNPRHDPWIKGGEKLTTQERKNEPVLDRGFGDDSGDELGCDEDVFG